MSAQRPEAREPSSPPLTHCVHGHAMTEENIAIRYSHGRPFRKCRTCKRAEVQRYNRTIKGTARHRAWQKIADLRHWGHLKSEPCMDCGEPEAVAHHPNGYEGEAALQIVWLCRKHHAARHRKVVAA